VAAEDFDWLRKTDASRDMLIFRAAARLTSVAEASVLARLRFE